MGIIGLETAQKSRSRTISELLVEPQSHPCIPAIVCTVMFSHASTMPFQLAVVVAVAAMVVVVAAAVVKQLVWKCHAATSANLLVRFSYRNLHVIVISPQGYSI